MRPVTGAHIFWGIDMSIEIIGFRAVAILAIYAGTRFYLYDRRRREDDNDFVRLKRPKGDK